MRTDGHDQIVEALGRLAVSPQRDLFDLVVTRWTRVPGSLGEMYVAFTERGVSYVRTAESVHDDARAFLASFRDRFERPLLPADRPPAGLLPALRGGGTRSLRLDLRGLTDFERDVLAATRGIPAGQTRPYGWIANEIGRPRAVRAVGTALGHNPVPVLIPCHRVTRSDGQPGEYVFGAAAKERFLIAEGVNLDEMRSLAQARVYYVGSDTTGIVCFPTCHNARRTNPACRRGFRTVDQAANAGYRPCRTCRPVPATSA